jgi:IS5 family transposase
MTPASFHDSRSLLYCTVNSLHTGQRLKKVYADKKGYHGESNRDVLSLNHIENGIMRKDTPTAKLTEYEKQRNKRISKKRYIIEQYFGLSHLHDGAKRARFPTIIKNIIDTMCRQAAFNIKRGTKLLAFT